jgi:septum formation protein
MAERAFERPSLILASASPRRRGLLAEEGYAFEVVPSEIEEPEPEPGTPTAVYVADLAWRKAVSVARRTGRGLVLAADTACAVEGVILNKPVDRADAERMIRLQEGRDTLVLTALCLLRADLWEWVGVVETSVVRFRHLTDLERDDYLDTNQWRDKAGAYGLQDRDPFITLSAGSFTNVVGLPMERLDALLRDHPSLTRSSDHD